MSIVVGLSLVAAISFISTLLYCSVACKDRYSNEEDELIEQEEFIKKWRKRKMQRLVKTRYTMTY